MANGTQQRREPEPAGETAQQRRARLDTEASMLAVAVAVADIEAGRVIADGDVNAWLDAWVRGEDVPLPASEPAPSRR